MVNIFMGNKYWRYGQPDAEASPDDRGSCEAGRLYPAIVFDRMRPCDNGLKCVEQMMKKMHSRKKSFNRRKPWESPGMIS